MRPSADDEIIRQIDVGHVVPHLDRHVDPGLTGWRSVQTLPRLSVVCDAGLHVALSGSSGESRASCEANPRYVVMLRRRKLRGL